MIEAGKASRRFANGVFSVGAILMIFVLVIVILRQDQYLTSVGRSIVFLGGPTIGLIFSLASLRFLPLNWRLNIALALVSVAAGLYGFEGYLTFLQKPAPSYIELLRRDGNTDIDTRTKYQVVSDLRQTGVTAVPSVVPEYLLQTGRDGKLHSPIVLNDREILPLSGIADTQTVLCNEAGRWVTYKADSIGFNNVNSVWANPQIIALGDSFVHGYCVDRQDNFVSHINRAYPGTLNLGMAGSGPQIQLAILREYGVEIKPDVVLWFFCESNDMGDMALEMFSPALMNYLQDGYRQDITSKRDEVDGALKRYVETLIQSQSQSQSNRQETDAGNLQSVISFVGLSRTRQALRLPTTLAEDNYALFQTILGAANGTVQGWGGHLVLVYLPDWSVATGTGDRFVEQGREILAVAERLGVPVIDIRPPFVEHPDPKSLYPHRRPAHFNESGHALVGETVRRGLVRLGLGTPAPDRSQ